MKVVIPAPPPCPRCAENRYARERFFAPASACCEEGDVILGRCENCGLRRFMLADGGSPPLRARPRWIPKSLLKRVRAAGSNAVLLAPAGTDIFSVKSVTRWGDNFPSGRLDMLWIWFSLEERLDVSAALAGMRDRLRPGGELRVTAVNPGALGFRLWACRDNYLEPMRQKVLFTPRLLAGFLRDAGFKRGRVSYNLARPVMRATAFSPE